MPKIKDYINKIPTFYRRQTIDLLMFSHVTAIREYTHDGKYNVTIEEAILNFMLVYGIPYDDYPMDSAKTTYTRLQQNFLWSEIKQKLNN